MNFSREEMVFPASDGCGQVYGEMLIPQGGLRGIFQIAHGMCDYVSRYQELFETLAAAGYVSLRRRLFGTWVYGSRSERLRA